MKKGFTLIEVLIAMMIIAGAIIALTTTWSNSLYAIRKSEKVEIITSLLKSKVTELEIKYKNGPYNEIKETESGDFGSEFKDLSWKSETKDLEFPDLSAILVNQGQGEEMLLTVIKQMTEHFSKNVKELKVTVIWKTKAKNMEYSVTTYLVNYENKVPSLGGG